MASIVISGDTSGSITVAAPAVAGSNTVTIPAITGNVVTTGDSGTITQAMLATAASSIGVGQTWQNVSGSRSSGVNYTNSTGKPIFVSGAVGFSANATITATVDGIGVANTGVITGGGTVSCSFIVPNGSVYSMTSNAGGFNIWAELR